MWLLLGLVMLVVWVVSFVVFKVASWAIHLLVIGAVIAGAIQLYRWIKDKQKG